MRTMILTIFMCALLAYSSNAQDVRLTIPQSSVNSLANALVQSKFLSYGHYDLGHFVDYYNFRPKSLSISILPGNSFTATIVADVAANFSMSGLFNYTLKANDESITMSGPIVIQATGTGYKIVFAYDQSSVQSSPSAWVRSVLQYAGSGLFGNLPEISTTVQLPLLSSIASTYFTSSTPTITTTTGQIVLSFTLSSADRFITTLNAVNGRVDVGSIQDEEGSNNYVAYASPKTFVWSTGSAHLIQTPANLINASNGTNKYQKWLNQDDIQQTETAPRRFQFTVGTADATFRGIFAKAQRVQLSNLLDGVSTAGTVTYDGTSGPSFDDYDFYDVSRLHLVSSAVPDGSLGTTWTFQSWSDGNSIQSRNLLLTTDYSLVASYKGHLRSGLPALGDAQNQRRVASWTASSGQSWYLVYESMGDVWLSFSPDAGQTWNPEVRLNSIQGQASNPSFSNVLLYNGTTPRVIVIWLEQNGAHSELHIQSLMFAVNFWGWNPSDGTRGTSNHRIVHDFGYTYPRSNARPVLQLDQTGSSYNLTVAYEGEGTGMVTGNIPINYDLGDIPAPLDILHRSIVVTTNGSDTHPVIIAYPSMYGFPARKSLYYLAGGYASGRRIVQYDYSTGVNTVLSSPWGDYTYYSLQGASNPGGASFALISRGVDVGSNGIVNTYYKPTYYGNSLPSLSTQYLNMTSPTIMVETNGSFGSPYVEYYMKQINGGGWLNSSLASVGTGISGIYTRDQVPPGDRVSLATRDNVSPAQIVRYSGSGTLLKTSHKVASRAIAMISTPSGDRASVLDFSDADVTLIDTLVTGNAICAVKFNSTSASNVLVRQIDSLAVPLGIDLVRNGSTIRSFASSNWKTISTSSIPMFQTGDILQFRWTRAMKSAYAYLQVNVGVDSALAKGNVNASHSGDKLVGANQALSIYPNPFNPSTNLVFTLAEPSHVRLAVYNVLGQEVALLADGYSDAGSHSVRLDGSRLASGVYYARYMITDQLGAITSTSVQRLMLLK